MAQVSCFLICCCDFCFLSAEWQRPEAVGDLDKIAMRVSFLGLGGSRLQFLTIATRALDKKLGLV